MDVNNIRNFSIISHIDHGKSTLADRFLELTETIQGREMEEQFLDSMDLEKEKGITIKMHPCRMRYSKDGEYILNLIDTPGHIDFSYEISRALTSVEGAILLVDANKGIQAQTIFNLEEAKKQNLKIIGVVNKIDLPQARVEETREELANLLGKDKQEIFAISAKTGEGVPDLLKAVVDEFPPPRFSKDENTRALIFDSSYDSYSGVVAYVRVFDGEINEKDNLKMIATKAKGEAKEVGYFSPELVSSGKLGAGEIGYVKTGVKEPAKVKVGDTLSNFMKEVEPLAGYMEPKPVLYLSIYPESSDNFEDLKQAMEKLRLNDPSLNFSVESSPGLGRGMRVGFLGSLQAEITLRRLKQEFDIDLVSTSPQVVFKVITEEGEEEVPSPDKWPHEGEIKKALEPWADVEVIVPNSYFSKVYKVLKKYKARMTDTKTLSREKSLVKAEAPTRKVIGGNFYDDIKSSTEGFASFSFREADYKEGDLVKMETLIAGEPEEALSKIVSEDEAYDEGSNFVKKLKEILPPQQFAVPIQAKVKGRIIARETKKAVRKDVTGALYGGDVTRKKKLLERQKKGKKELKKKGSVNIPSEVFLKILRD